MSRSYAGKMGVEDVPWWKSSAARLRVRGWNARTLVCERCRGLGWVDLGTGRRPIVTAPGPCPFCGVGFRCPCGSRALELTIERKTGNILIYCAQSGQHVQTIRVGNNPLRLVTH